MMPLEWNSVLAKLQDDMPADRESYVKKTIEKTFGKSIEDVFYEFNYKPLASASVAQVHEAYMRSKSGQKGIKVALKIQHEGIEDVMKKDMVAFRRIVKLCGFLNHKFKPIYSMLCAWEKEILLELDFRIEAENIKKVRNNLKQMKLISKDSEEELSQFETCSVDEQDTVLVPQLIKSFVRQKVFLMTFISGFKLTNETLMSLYKVNKVELMKRIVEIYGIQLFVNGIFNADPHAGNILVNIDTKGYVRPVLLDFGMVIKLKEKERIGYCRLLYSLSQLSITCLSEALKEVGYINSQSHIVKCFCLFLLFF